MSGMRRISLGQGLLFFLCFFLIGCSGNGVGKNNIPLSQFIIGRWQGHFPQSGYTEGKNERVQVEFLDSGVVVLNVVTTSEDGSKHLNYYNHSQQYHFVNQSSINVEGRLIETWNLEADGASLLISNSMIIPNGLYERVPTIQWPIFSLFIILILIACILLFRRYLRKQKALSEGSVMGKSKKDSITSKRKASLYLIGSVILVGALILGGVLGKYSWNSWQYFIIRLPWDSLIFLELSFLLLVVGIFLGLDGRAKIMRNLVSKAYVEFLGGALSIGFSLTGIFFSLLALTLFVVFKGSYGYGA